MSAEVRKNSEGERGDAGGSYAFPSWMNDTVNGESGGVAYRVVMVDNTAALPLLRFHTVFA